MPYIFNCSRCGDSQIVDSAELMEFRRRVICHNHSELSEEQVEKLIHTCSSCFEAGETQ